MLGSVMDKAPTTPPTRRRWFQFWAGAILTLVIAFAVWFGSNARHVHEREQVAFYVVARQGKVVYGPPTKPWRILPFSLRIAGAKPVREIHLDWWLCRDEQENVRQLFPEAEVHCID
jgi:hypothetical protein